MLAISKLRAGQKTPCFYSSTLLSSKQAVLTSFNSTQRRWKWKNVYRPGPPIAIIDTLDPISIHPRCFVDLSGQKAAEVGVRYVPVNVNSRSKPGEANDREDQRNTLSKYRLQNVIITVTSRPPVHKAHTLRPFASNVRGFLYWHLDPGVPAPFGQVRFRVIPADHPRPTTRAECRKSFLAGYDFIQPITGFPWAQNLMKIFHRPTVQPLASLLVNNGLVTVDGLKMAKSLGQGKSRVMWEFGQTFPWNFLDKVLTMDIAYWPLGKETTRPHFDRVRLFMPAKDKSWKIKGSAVCCFEPYTVPATSSEPAKEAVAIRIVKIFEEPVQLMKEGGRTFEPKEGELLAINGRTWYRVPSENREPPKSGLKDSWGALRYLRKPGWYEEYLRSCSTQESASQV